MKNIEVQISDIQIGERHRKAMGDLEGLARSIKADELFHPIGLTPQNELIFGLRRLTACREILGWTTIPARIIDVASIVHGEFVENSFRKDLTLSERVTLADALRAYSHGGDRRSDQLRNCEVEALTVDEAAKRAGLGGKDDYYRFMKAKENGVPELMEAIDTGKVSVSLAAKIAGLPPEDQQESVRRGKLVEKRDPHDFYPTPRGVTEALLQHVQFPASVWEPACGDGAISEVLQVAGYSVDSSDLIDRGYGDVEDFMTTSRRAESIITNPPYSKAEEFVRRALELTTGKVAMLLPLTFLESERRESLFENSCLKWLYVFRDRIPIYKGGAVARGNGRVAYAWYVWEHGHAGPPMIGWVHSERKGVILGPLPDCDGTAPITLDLSATEMPDNRQLELISELRIHIEEAHELGRPMQADLLLSEWADWEGMTLTFAERLMKELPAEVRGLLDNGLPPAA
ncbi:MAG: ParB N-terminal domain-containing protein [Planctomycetaceae bacterium]|nr:ParB N-terminal domain-containing protein [Planctomycetaceae bacterium]